MPSPSRMAMDDEWNNSLSHSSQMRLLINARNDLRDVKRQHATSSDIEKACDAAILSIEIAWSLLDGKIAAVMSNGTT